MRIRSAKEADFREAAELDCHIPPDRLAQCIAEGRVLVLSHSPAERVEGLLRYSLFWQTTPFLDLIFLREPYRRRGYGTAMMDLWEREMKRVGYHYVMTSTQADEEAWRFYEKLGYRRVGGFLPPEQEAEEWLYLKNLKE